MGISEPCRSANSYRVIVRLLADFDVDGPPDVYPVEGKIMGRAAMLMSSSLLAAAMLSGCGGGSSPSPQSAGPPTSATSAQSSSSVSPVAGSEIVISNMSYTVPPSVKPGQQVTIVNNDSANHTVTADENNLF